MATVLNNSIIGVLLNILDEGFQEDSQYIKHRIMQNTMLSVSIVASASLIRNSKARINNYVEYVMSMYSMDDFKDRFRMSRSTFEQLLEDLTPVLNKKGNNLKVGPEKQLLIFVKFVSSLHTLQAIADMFGVCETTVYVIIKDIANKLCKHVLPSVITWPTTRQRISEIEDAFKQLKGFPAVLGAIDGTHIPIKTPKEHAENYINRKGFPSIILQAVCDSNLNFLDVYCGWPGSVHDARVLKNSPLYIDAEADPDKFPGNTHLLGDSAYGLSSWLIVPFKDYGNLSEHKKRFNYLHSATRMRIEHAFGALKGRFRRLKYLDMLDPEKNVQVILSCCALHELCLNNSEDINEYIQEGLAANEEVNNYQDFMVKSQSAEVKRNQIMELLCG